MSQTEQFNVSNFVDNQPVRPITLLVMFLCFLAMLSEGYNLGAASLAAPGILIKLHLERPMIAPMFSAALVGMLLGALGGGAFGDRFGRKRAILVSVAIICVSSLACGYANSLRSLLMLRFCVGIGLGGLLPNVTALMAEFVPKKVRGTMTTYAFMGITFGGTLPGIVSSQFVAGDWRSIFMTGGFLALGIIPGIFIFLPESIKFLALEKGNETRIRGILQRMVPGLDISPNTEFVLNERARGQTVGSLFSGNLRWITAALWLSYICIMMVNFFFNSWFAIVLGDLGFSTREAAASVSLYYVGGICGGLIMGVALDRIGTVMLAIYPILGCVVSALFGLPGNSHLMSDVLVTLVGFSVLGTQVGMSALSGLTYPTSVRSKGAGLAHSIGRLGAIAGPLLAGFLMSKNSSFFTLFLVPLVPLSFAALGFLTITKVWTGRFLGRGLSKIGRP